MEEEGCSNALVLKTARIIKNLKTTVEVTPLADTPHNTMKRV